MLILTGFSFGMVAQADDLIVQVANQEATALVNAKVYVYHAGGDYAGVYAYTDGNGMANLGPVDQFSAGEYKFKVKYAGVELYTADHLLPDTTRVDVVIETADVRVSVISVGEPAINATVYVCKGGEEDCCHATSATTDEQGEAIFPLPIGQTYKFRATVLDYKYWSADLTTDGSGTQSTLIDCGGGQLQIDLQEDSGQPIISTKIKLYNASGCYLGQYEFTDMDGTVQFAVPAGSYQFKAEYMGHYFWHPVTQVSGDSQWTLTIPHHDVPIFVKGLYEQEEPLADVKVELYTDTGGWIGTKLYTDAQGQAVFHLPDQGYKVRAYFMGSYYWSDPFEVSGATVSIPMAEAGVDATWNGAPLGDLLIYAVDDTSGCTKAETRTDVNGRAVFRLPAKTWKFKTRYQGNDYWSLPTALDPYLFTPVSLSTGGGTFSLGLTKDDGTALENITCKVYTESGSYTGVAGVTDSQGNVSFDLADGIFKVKICYLGYDYYTELYEVPTVLSDTVVIEHKDVRIQVKTLFGQDETPLADKKVTLYTGSGQWLGHYQKTDSNGDVYYSLPEKAYKVKVDHLSKTFWSDVFNGHDSLVSIPLGEVQVTVLGAGEPREGVWVCSYTPEENRVTDWYQTDAGGSFAFHLPAGDFKFRAYYLKHSFFSDVVPLAEGASQAVEINMGGGNYTLTVNKSTVEPLPNVKCYLYNNDGTKCLGMDVNADENGQAHFDLVEGSYKIAVSYLGYKFFTDVIEVPQSLSSTLTIPHRDVAVQVNGVYHGTEPMNHVKVYIRKGDGGWLPLNDYTDENGKVVFSLPLQDYFAKACYQGKYFESPTISGSSAVIDIPMAAASINFSAAGQKIEDVWVQAYTDQGGCVENGNDKTDFFGTAAILLSQGAYKFRASYQGRYFWSEPVTLTAENLHNISIDAGGGLLRLRVQKDAYSPINKAYCYLYTDTDACTGVYGTTDAQGLVTFALTDGDFKVKVKAFGQEFYTDTFNVPDVSTYTLEIPHERYSVFFQGLNPGPEPLAGVKCYVYTLEGKCTGSYAYVDSYGRVLFDLPPNAYKLKYNYNGQEYWIDLTGKHHTLVSMNLSGTPVLDPVAGFSIAVNASQQVELSWLPPANAAELNLMGYAVYRRPVCAPTFTRLNPDLLPGDTTEFLDTTVSETETYIYYVSAVSDQGVEGYPSALESIVMGTPGAVEENDTAVSGVSIIWEQGQPLLSWNNAGDSYAYQIFRGKSADQIDAYTRVDGTTFTDTAASPYQSWYYQVSTVREYCDPETGATLPKVGPLSSMVALQAHTAPTINVEGAEIAPDGKYIVRVGPDGKIILQGTYDTMLGDVQITASVCGETITGTAENGQFYIELPSSGNWKIVLSETSGWHSVTIGYHVIQDEMGPTLFIDGALERTTTFDSISLTGTATDANSALSSVTFESNRFADLSFGAVVGADGRFSGEIPLRPGVNQITITARDYYGNTTSRSMTVTMSVPALPALTILAPVSGSTVFENQVDVSGVVTSSLPPSQITLHLGEQSTHPSGSNFEYDFTFQNVTLAQGVNTLEVRAETPHGTVRAQTLVTFQGGSDLGPPPVIEVLTPLPGQYLVDSPIVAGMVRCPAGVEEVLVNGAACTMTGAGTAYVSFQADLAFPSGQSQLDITVSARDKAGRSSALTLTVYQDAEAPQILLDDTTIAAPPAVNTISQTPYVVSGRVVETNLAGLSINEQPVTLTPGDTEGTWTFNASLAISAGQNSTIRLTAWDFAGNRTDSEWLVLLENAVGIEIISPRDNSRFTADAAEVTVPVAIRVTGADAGDSFILRLDEGQAAVLARSGQIGNGSLLVPTDREDHLVTVRVVSSSGVVKGFQTARIQTINTAALPLTLEKQTPANNASGVEPNSFLAFYFNKAIDPQQLEVTVTESAHGLVYGNQASGADITQINEIKLVEVHRDQEPVPGGVSYLPGNVMAAFYPERDLAYGGTVYVSVRYQGNELSRSSFTVRPLPTFIQGFVADQFGQPLAGVEVLLPKLNRTAVSDERGNFGFGFGEPASRDIPGGRYQVMVNPGLKARPYGSVEHWITVQPERYNAIGILPIPILNANEPLRPIQSGQAQALLAASRLTLDLSQANLLFPDGRVQGNVHVQFMGIDQIAYPGLASVKPQWLYAVHPIGIEVSGRIALRIALPPLNGAYDYVRGLGARVVLIGLDPETLHLVPVGIGAVDPTLNRVESEGPVVLERLDYIGYAAVPAEQQPLLEGVANGDISLRELIGLMQSGQ